MLMCCFVYWFDFLTNYFLCNPPFLCVFASCLFVVFYLPATLSYTLIFLHESKCTKKPGRTFHSVIPSSLSAVLLSLPPLVIASSVCSFSPPISFLSLYFFLDCLAEVPGLSLLGLSITQFCMHSSSGSLTVVLLESTCEKGKKQAGEGGKSK